MHADVKKNTLELLYDSFIMPKESFLWITSSGKIISLAAQWKSIKLDDTMHITTNTDCLALKSCAASRKFTLIMGQKIVENLSAHHALNILLELHTNVFKKESSHVSQNNFQSYNDTHFS
jgi:hypothetical protein